MVASSRRQHQIPQTPLRVWSDFVHSAAVVRDLGIYLDSDASMTSHVSRTASACYGVLRQIRSMGSVTRQVHLSLITALVLSKLD